MALDSQSSANRALSFETPADFAALKHPVDVLWRVEDISSAEVRRNPRWLAAFSGERKDRRYYEVCEETIDQEFDYRYLALKDERGEICAIQPYFINDQDVLAEASPELLKFLSPVRHLWPRFMKMRTLMLGCPAGHGHLDARDGISGHRLAQSLASVITGHAKRLRASVIVFKEFTVHDRPVLSCLEDRGFKRVPSMPLTQVKLDFSTFEDYLRNVLSRNMRSKLRRKFRFRAARFPRDARCFRCHALYRRDLPALSGCVCKIEYSFREADAGIFLPDWAEDARQDRVFLVVQRR